MKTKSITKLFLLAAFAFSIVSSTTSSIVKYDSIESAYAYSGEQVSDYPNDYYDDCLNLTGDELRNELASFNNPRSKSYDWGRYEDADEAEGYNNKVICLYSRELFDKSAHVGGSYSSTTWNREHIFTQTAFPNSDTDNHNIFACEGYINNIRGSKHFGEVAHTSANRVTTYGVARDCYTTGSYFEPCDDAKGEVARAVMYCCIYYDYEITDIFDSVETCLDWHNTYSVTDRDIYRNNAVYENQGNRNPFVDHPEFANYIWGDGDNIVMPSNLSLQVGEQYQLDAYVNGYPDIDVNYSSNNNDVVTVDSDGLLTAVSEGNAVITAQAYFGSDLLTASCNITVSKAIVLESIVISPSFETIKINETLQLKITPTPSNASSSVKYESSNPSVASVNASGLVRGIGQGSTTIKATSLMNNNITATATINVVSSSAASGSFEKVDIQLNDYNGTYLIVYESSNSLGYVFNPGADNVNSSGNYVEFSIDDGVISDADAASYAVEISGTSGAYNICYDGTKYIYSSKNDNRIDVSSSPAPSNSISYVGNSTDIVSSSAHLRFNSGWHGFRYYKSASYQNQSAIQLYKLVEQSYSADDFANNFLNDLVCDPSGNSAPSKDVWNNLSSLFMTLSAEDKQLFKTAASSGSDDIALCVERYDYIIQKYGASEYPDFMSRGVDLLLAPYLYNNINDTQILICMISLVIASNVTAIIIVAVILKKKKHSNK